MPEDNRGLGDARLQELAETAAEKAVLKTLRRLRIRADNDDEVDLFVDTMIFARELRAKRDEITAALAYVAEQKANHARRLTEARNTVWSTLRKLTGLLAMGAAGAIGTMLGMGRHFWGGAP